MADSMKRMCSLLVFVAIFGTAFRVLAEAPETQKTWSFPGKEGEVKITLTSFVEKNGKKTASLHIFCSVGASRSVVEEAGFLAIVLDGLPKEGINAQSLTSISLRFNEAEARSRVATYAALSKSWRGALKTKNVSVVYPLVTSFLNESGAYKEWDSVFRLHGLTLRVAGVEEVIMEPFSRAQTNCPVGANCKDLLVPSDALIQMNVTPINRAREPRVAH